MLFNLRGCAASRTQQNPWVKKDRVCTSSDACRIYLCFV